MYVFVFFRCWTGCFMLFVTNLRRACSMLPTGLKSSLPQIYLWYENGVAAFGFIFFTDCLQEINTSGTWFWHSKYQMPIIYSKLPENKCFFFIIFSLLTRQPSSRVYSVEMAIKFTPKQTNQISFRDIRGISHFWTHQYCLQWNM